MPIVPAYLFSKEWLEANFPIPGTHELRIERRDELEGYSRMGIMFVPGNERVRTVLLARVAAIKAHDAVLVNAKGG